MGGWGGLFCIHWETRLSRTFSTSTLPAFLYHCELGNRGRSILLYNLILLGFLGRANTVLDGCHFWGELFPPFPFFPPFSPLFFCAPFAPTSPPQLELIYRGSFAGNWGGLYSRVEFIGVKEVNFRAGWVLVSPIGFFAT